MRRNHSAEVDLIKIIFGVIIWDAVCKPLRVCIKVVYVNEKWCVRVLIGVRVCIKVVCVNEKWCVRVIMWGCVY